MRHVIGPTLAAAGEVLPMGQQTLVQLAGEQGDAIHPGVVAEEGAGEADLVAAAGLQHHLIEVGPLLGAALGRQRKLDSHDNVSRRTPVLASLKRAVAPPQVAGLPGGLVLGSGGAPAPGLLLPWPWSGGIQSSSSFHPIPTPLLPGSPGAGTGLDLVWWPSPSPWCRPAAGDWSQAWGCKAGVEG